MTLSVSCRASFPPLSLPDGRTITFGPVPLIMGIVNVTPDSFSDGGLFEQAEPAIAQGLRLAGEGAQIIDIGGESTRPGHAAIDAQTELARVLPVIAGVRAGCDLPISIDTYKADTGERALAAGAQIVNDVWGLQREPALARVAARHGAPVILMHNRDSIDASLDILDEVRRFLERSIATARNGGIAASQIVLDPGIGFGKTPGQNLRLIRELSAIRAMGHPVLLGVSRKSTLGRITGQSVAAERVAATLAANLYGMLQGADIIRVHDVRPHTDALKVWAAIESGTG